MFVSVTYYDYVRGLSNIKCGTSELCAFLDESWGGTIAGSNGRSGLDSPGQPTEMLEQEGGELAGLPAITNLTPMMT